QQVAADEQRYLVQKDALAELESRRALVPHLQEEIKAELEAAAARLRQVEYELESTRIRCPFEARVESVSAHSSQVVTAPFAMATLTDMEAFEISVGIDPRELRWLTEDARPAALEQADNEATAEVLVRSTFQGREYTWRGYVTRFERIDEVTRTARLIVEVRNMDMASRGTVSGRGGPSSLAIGMYCRTELPAKPLEDAIMVPRHAIHENEWVYVVEPPEDPDSPSTGILGIRRVPILRTVGSSVLVDFRERSEGGVCELKPGERVVVSPMSEPIPGMRVRVHDEHLALAPFPNEDVQAIAAIVNDRDRVEYASTVPTRFHRLLSGVQPAAVLGQVTELTGSAAVHLPIRN
ncbi:MAG: hypothetical protein ABIG68_04065, partial [Acidobacteriota bacterium]